MHEEWLWVGKPGEGSEDMWWFLDESSRLLNLCKILLNSSGSRAFKSSAVFVFFKGLGGNQASAPTSRVAIRNVSRSFTLSPGSLKFFFVPSLKSRGWICAATDATDGRCPEYQGQRPKRNEKVAGPNSETIGISLCVVRFVQILFRLTYYYTAHLWIMSTSTPQQVLFGSLWAIWPLNKLETTQHLGVASSFQQTNNIYIYIYILV